MKIAPIVISILFLPQATSSALAAQITPSRLCEGYDGTPQHFEQPYPGMVWVPGGNFIMGDNDERSEERAAHKVSVSGFWIDRHEVTNAQFAMFVEATGYRTIAERGLDPKERPDLSPELLVPGASVFHQPANLMNLIDIGQWWRFVPGANWRHPTGPDSSIEGKANLPVVDVAYEDARAYAHWLGRELPTEAQWEFAARGGLDGATYAWGENYYDPIDGWRANSWQGTFPLSDTGEDGYHGTAPVGCFPANGHGLFDMIGNVWEYAADWYLPRHPPASATDPNGPPREVAANYAEAADPLVVIKGGSWLCAPNFCARYRPAARQPQELSLGASHLGFRTVIYGPPIEEDVPARAEDHAVNP